MHTIVIDVQITARKRYHFVMDELGDQVFAARQVWPCVQFIASFDEHEYYMVRADLPDSPVLVRALQETEQEQWQNSPARCCLSARKGKSANRWSQHRGEA